MKTALDDAGIGVESSENEKNFFAGKEVRELERKYFDGQKGALVKYAFMCLTTSFIRIRDYQDAWIPQTVPEDFVIFENWLTENNVGISRDDARSYVQSLIANFYSSIDPPKKY